MAWWRDAVIYQVYPRSFQDTNRDGIGDLEGVRRRLPYLSELGVDAVWLSPFYPSPMADFGYDVADYCNVDPIFGTLGDFDRLVGDVHSAGLKLIVDWVPNHTSDRHPWFEASRSSRGNSKRDWYVWADPRPDGSPPNNWQSVFGGSAWEWDDVTGQYYLHSFLAEQPDLNWRNPEVEAAMFDVLRFWLDRGVDGFRMDVVSFIMKDPELRDDPEPPSDLPLNSRAHPDVHPVFRRIRTLLDSYDPPRVAIGEIHEPDWERWASYYGEGRELHLPFNFSLLHAPWNPKVIRGLVDACDAAVPAGEWPNYVLGNHDEIRLASRIGTEQTRIAAMLLLTLRGTPTLYYGDEIGMEQFDIPPERQQDPWGRRMPGMGRDGCRTPMRWQPGANAGFCDPDVEPWLPVGDGPTVASMAADPASLLNLYRRLLALRRTEPLLRSGAYRSVDGPPGCLAFERFDDDRVLGVMLNFGVEAVTLSEPRRVRLSTLLDRSGGEIRVLQPHEGVVFDGPAVRS